MLKSQFFFFLILLKLVLPDQIQTDICIITYQTVSTSIQLVSCEERDTCIDGSEGTGSECAQYSYRQLGLTSQCATTCCPELGVSILQTVEQVQTCLYQYQIREILRIGIIIGAIVIVIIILMIIGLTYLYGYERNPNTGQRKYVGCLCCRKAANFNPEEGKEENQNDKIDPMEQAETGNRF